MEKSPFPGMDPFMERDWLDLHVSLIGISRARLNRQLPPPLRARAEQRVYVETENDEWQTRQPDVFVREQSAGRESDSSSAVTAVSVFNEVQPVTVVFSEPVIERFLEIVDANSGDKVVTVIEFLSPTNKRAGSGQDEYLVKRQEYLHAGANLVEIDLNRAGSRSNLFPNVLTSQKAPATYMVGIRRIARPQEIQVYPIPLAATLPKIAIPLRKSDQEISLDLQEVIEQAYVDGHNDMIDYSKPLDPPLSGPDAEFAEQLLKAAGKR